MAGVSPVNNRNVARGFWPLVCFLLHCWGAAAVSQPAMAASPTATFAVSLTISAACTVTTGPITAAAQSVLGSPAAQRGLVVATCTNPSPYNVTIEPVAGPSVTTTQWLANDLYQVTVSF